MNAQELKEAGAEMDKLYDRSRRRAIVGVSSPVLKQMLFQGQDGYVVAEPRLKDVRIVDASFDSRYEILNLTIESPDLEPVEDKDALPHIRPCMRRVDTGFVQELLDK